MNRTTLISLVCVAAGLLAGWRVGGLVGNGIVLGTFAGVGVTALGLAYQRQALERRPQFAVGVLGLFLVVKLFCLLGLGLTLRYWPPAAERADLRATLLTFVGAAFVVLLVGTVENARRLRVAHGGSPGTAPIPAAAVAGAGENQQAGTARHPGRAV